jgi:thiol-disulfide isomerase/thioredoxin
MTRGAKLAIVIAAAGVGLIAGLTVRLAGWSEPGPPIASASAAGAAGLMAAQLPDTNGQKQTLERWRGRVLVVNFWATWCAPCRQEIPEFIKVQEKWGSRGVQVVGIAIDESDKVRPYAAQLRINYPILIAGLDGIELARQAGNRLGGLPFTVILNRKGTLAHSQLGGVNEQKLEAFIQPLL